MKKYFLLVLGLLVYGGTSYAETIEGTVTSVDQASGTLTVSQSNPSNEPRDITVTLNDTTQLQNLQTGAMVRLDATEQGGTFIADSLEVAVSSAEEDNSPADARGTMVGANTDAAGASTAGIGASTTGTGASTAGSGASTTGTGASTDTGSTSASTGGATGGM